MVVASALAMTSHVAEPDQQQLQARSIERNFRRMTRLSDVYRENLHAARFKRARDFP